MKTLLVVTLTLVSTLIWPTAVMGADQTTADKTKARRIFCRNIFSVDAERTNSEPKEGVEDATPPDPIRTFARKAMERRAASVESFLAQSKLIREAEEVLERDLSYREMLAVFNAHFVGFREAGADGSPAHVHNYTRPQIRKKFLILRAAGFPVNEARVLIRSGTVGVEDVPPHAQIHHQSAFTLKLHNENQELGVIMHLYDWLNERLAQLPNSTAEMARAALGNTEAERLENFTKGIEWSQSGKATHLSSYRYTPPEGRYQYWAFSLRLPDRDNRYRNWQTSLTITFEGLLAHIYTQTHHWLAPGYYAQNAAPKPSRPRFVQRLLESPDEGILAASINGSPLFAEAKKITNAQALNDLLDQLENPQRTLPIIVMSNEYASEGFMISPKTLQSRVLGLANIYYLEGPELVSRSRLGQKGKAFLAHGGGLQIYEKVVNFSDPQDAHRHTFFDRQQLRASPQQILDLIIGGVIRDVRPILLDGRVNQITTPSQLENLAVLENAHREINRLVKIMDYRQKAPDAEKNKNAEEIAKILELGDAEIAKLETKNDELQAKNNELQEKNLELELIIDELISEKEALRRQLSEGKEEQRDEMADVGVDPALRPIDDLVELLHVMRDKFPERVLVTDKAMKTAGSFVKELKKKPSRETNRALNRLVRAARLFPTAIYDAHFSGLRGVEANNIAKEVFIANGLSGVEIKDGEGPQTKSNPKYARIREDVHPEIMDGRTFVAWPHLSYGIKPGEQFRVYYYIDRVANRIVISCFDDHLENSLSRNM